MDIVFTHPYRLNLISLA